MRHGNQTKSAQLVLGRLDAFPRLSRLHQPATSVARTKRRSVKSHATGSHTPVHVRSEMMGSDVGSTIARSVRGTERVT